MIPAILAFAGPIIDKVIGLIPNENERAKAKEDMEAAIIGAATQAMQAQAEINKVEAGHQSLFVAGWRPAAGWVGVTALAWTYIGHPMATWAVAAFDLGYPVPPKVDDAMLELVLAMLGLGGMRTWEKSRGLVSAVRMPWQR